METHAKTRMTCKLPKCRKQRGGIGDYGVDMSECLTGRSGCGVGLVYGEFACFLCGDVGFHWVLRFIR